MEIKCIKSEEVKLDCILMENYKYFNYLTYWTFKNIYSGVEWVSWILIGNWKRRQVHIHKHSIYTNGKVCTWDGRTVHNSPGWGRQYFAEVDLSGLSGKTLQFGVCISWSILAYVSKSVSTGSRDVTISICPTNPGILWPVWSSSVQDTDILG